MTHLYRGTPSGEILDAFPHPPSDPRQWDYDEYFRSKGYTKEPLYRAATVDVAGMAVKVPERAAIEPRDTDYQEGYCDGVNNTLDALGVK